MHKSNHIKTAIKDQNQAYNSSTTEPLDLKLLPIVAGPAWLHMTEQLCRHFTKEYM